MSIFEQINRYLRRVWNGLIFLFPALLFLVLLAGLGVALLSLTMSWWISLEETTQNFIPPLMDTIQTLIFIVTGLFVYVQLTQAAEQQKRDRLVAWKNSVQQICQDILKHPKPYIPLLYGEEADEEQSKKFVAAFASLHSLETIYFMRKDEEVPPTDLRKFVEGFITTSDDFQNFWRNEAFRPAFTLEFQKEVNSILGSTTISSSSSPTPPQTPQTPPSTSPDA